jgi:integrase
MSLSAPRLLDRLRFALRARHCSVRTETAYVAWVRRYILFHGKRDPMQLGAAELESFLSSAQSGALAAVLFLYREVLELELPELADVLRAKRPLRLPNALARGEVARVLAQLAGVPRIVGWLLHGTGLRLRECLRLRVKDVDFAGNLIRLREGKGTATGSCCCPRAFASRCASSWFVRRRCIDGSWRYARAGSSCRPP